MSLSVISVDTAVLPAALLPLAKQQMRIDWSGGDEEIKSMIFRAIGRIEDKTDIRINPGTWRWRPEQWNNNGKNALPIQPVTAFTAQAGTPPADASANYAIMLKWETASGPPIQIMSGAAADGLEFELTAGLPPAGPDILPAQILDVVLRFTAHIWEHREILLAGRDFVSPDLASELVWWVPRV